MMSELIVEPPSLVSAATQIHDCATRIGELGLNAGLGTSFMTQTFSTLAGSFRGATDDMSGIAAHGDRLIQSSLSTASNAVSAFAELVMACRNTTVETDQSSGKLIRDAVAYPARVGPATDHPVPVPILMDVLTRAPR
ncbi:hypothetical protein GOALK_053_00750 [Gordonia alkanivorans NBRC 16433]|jgi:hypothetical protein|uniref:Uncharacterized protein n=1 Tax=Gordonia alkanivorans NBRC 16433 TaxID=1027371 RepID=F9VVB6_9ACTN|nr:hypothetical protein GOALK_053_00750 [Gordonia alkanivorans NBRC 16433]